MRQRGRKSAASLAVARTAIGVERLAAPVHLSDAERSVWIEAVNDQPAEAFTPVYAPMLELYCRHVVRSRVLAEEIEAFDRAWLADDDGLKRYDRLLGMAEREARAANALARSLRITRQSVIHPTVAGNANAREVRSRKPWELPAHEED